MPPLHTSPYVHLSPSSQAVPSAALPNTQPLAASHKSAVHGLPSSHAIALPTQLPCPHKSGSLQALPSLHGVLSSAKYAQSPVFLSHVSLVQGLPSSQPDAAIALHCPPVHAAAVQKVPSILQAPPSITPFSQPNLPQTSLVHGLLSLQSLFF